MGGEISGSGRCGTAGVGGEAPREWAVRSAGQRGEQHKKKGLQWGSEGRTTGER